MKSPVHNGSYSVGSISFEMLNLTALTHVTLRYRKISDSEITKQTTTPTNIPTSSTATTPATIPATTPTSLPYNTSTTDQTPSNQWIGNFTMKYQGYSRWTHSARNFAEGEYELQIFGMASEYSYPTSPDRVIGTVMLENTIFFHVDKEEIDWGPILILGFAAVVALASAAFVGFWLIRRRRLLV